MDDSFFGFDTTTGVPVRNLMDNKYSNVPNVKEAIDSFSAKITIVWKQKNASKLLPCLFLYYSNIKMLNQLKCEI